MKLCVQGNLVRLRDAQYWASGQWNDITGTVGATLTASILNTDTAQSPVANAQNIAMTLDAPTANDWSCIMPANATLTDQTMYWVQISVTVGGATVPVRQKFQAAYPDGSAVPG